jgi:putative phage-type endonuclease
MPAVELLPPGEAVHGNERWYELRRTGVTASEIAVVLGISPYESPFSLYWSKVNDWRWEGNVYADTGRHLEDAIADWWMAEHDPLENLADGLAGLYAHPDRPWQLATPDRLLYLRCDMCDGRGGAGLDPCADCMCAGYKPDGLVSLLECKWVAYSWDGWGEPGTEEIPVYYRAQCLWQADVLGVDEVHVAALGPGGFRAYLVRRDETDLAVMREAGAEFVRRLDDRDPPDLDSHAATLATLKRLHPAVGEGDVEVPAELAEAYRIARADRKDAEARIDRCEAEIRAALGGTYRRAVCGGKPVASRSVFDVRRIDVDLLRTERPDVAEQYVTKSTTDRLTPGRAESYAT